MTPVVSAQLDDPYCLNGVHHWLASAGGCAERAAQRACPSVESADYPSCTPEALRALGFANADAARVLSFRFAARWRHGGSPAARPDRRRHGGAARWPCPHVPAAGIRAARKTSPMLSCGWHTANWARMRIRPGDGGRATPPRGVSHFMVDGPSLHESDTALGRPVGKRPM